MVAYQRPLDSPKEVMCNHEYRPVGSMELFGMSEANQRALICGKYLVETISWFRQELHAL
jgi:hypothetical protein